MLAAGHSLVNGQKVRINTDAKNVELEGEVFDVTNVTASGFDIEQGGSPYTTALDLTGTPSFVRVVSTLTGLNHLEGETVDVLVDGAPVAQKVVASGSVTLDEPGAAFVAGLPYDATLKTMKIESGGRAGTAQGKIGRWHGLVVRCHQTGPGLFVASTLEDLDDDDIVEEVFFPDSDTVMDTPIPLLDGDTEDIEFPGDFDRGKTIAVRHRAPLPCSIVALMPSGMTHERT